MAGKQRGGGVKLRMRAMASPLPAFVDAGVINDTLHRRPVTVTSTVFVTPQRLPDGQLVPSQNDFEADINKPETRHVLFVYNENCEQWHNKQDLGRGGGNAAIRGYRRYRAIGIPTGPRGGPGFDSLDTPVPLSCKPYTKAKGIIDAALEEICQRLRSHPELTEVRYSADPTVRVNGQLRIGTGIFDVDYTVLEYITNQLHKLLG